LVKKIPFPKNMISMAKKEKIRAKVGLKDE
jgi:hypothetical protein